MKELFPNLKVFLLGIYQTEKEGLNEISDQSDLD